MFPAQIKAPLYCALWSDNNIVKTLSNFHSPKLLPAGSGVRRKRRVDGKREQHKTEVSCPAQNKDYSETFHLIDKGNGAEATYDMGGHSWTHNWSPKIQMRYFNMNFNNAFKIYRNLMEKYTPNRRPLRMKGGVSELANHLMQRGEPMRLQKAEHPTNSRDLTNMFDFGTGRKIRSDAHGEVACKGRPQTGAMLQKNKFLNGLKKAP